MTMLKAIKITEVKEYQIISKKGRSVKEATVVVFSDGTEVRFFERLARDEAMREAMKHRVRQACINNRGKDGK